MEEAESFLQRNRRRGKLSTAQSKKWKAFYSASSIEEVGSFLQRNRRSGKLSTAQSKKWEAFYSAIEEVGSFLQSTSSPEINAFGDGELDSACPYTNLHPMTRESEREEVSLGGQGESQG